MRVLMLSSDPNVLDPRKEAYERMCRYREVIGELHILVPRGNVLKRLFSFYFEGALLCRWHRFDVITAQGPDELGIIGYLLSRRFGVPLQLQIHTDIFSPWYIRAGWKERVRFYIAKFLIPRADCVRVVSQRIRDSISRKQDLLKEIRFPYITVLPIFTDVSKFFNAAPDPDAQARFRDYDFKMIAVGRFVDKEKNFSILIEMMRDFVKICPQALLVIVGDGPDRKNYEARIKNQGLGKYVILEEWRDDLSSFYKSFDLYLMSSNYEGWGRTVIEAMAAGLPVIMTDVGLAGEVVQNEINGLVVPVADRQAMLRAFTDLYKNPKLRARFSKAGLATVKHLEPKTKEEYLRLYKDSFSGCLYNF